MDTNSIDYYESEFLNLNKFDVSTSSKNEIGIERGIDGERRVYDILSKYSTNIFYEVVLWDKSHKFTTELDFICEINNFLVLVEVKDWYGVMELHPEREKIYLSQINLNGHFFKQIRTSPTYSMGAYTKDLKRYLRPNQPYKDTQLKRAIVFARDELEIKGDFSSAKMELCKLNELELWLENIKNTINEFPYVLQKDLPSWDYYYDKKSQRWYKTAIVSEEIETDNGAIKTSKISSILFDENNIDYAYIKLLDGSQISCNINRKSILINSFLKFAQNRVKFIKLNKVLHGEVCTD